MDNISYIARPGQENQSPQSLINHIDGVIKKASGFARPLNYHSNPIKIDKLVKLSSSLHDLMKYSHDVQTHLRDADGDSDYATRKRGPDHSTGGVLWLLTHGGCVDKNLIQHRLLIGIVGNVSISHHSGLMDTHSIFSPTVNVNTYERRVSKYIADRIGVIDEVNSIMSPELRNKIISLWDEAVDEFNDNYVYITECARKTKSPRQYLKFSVWMMTKMAFSCLVDADHQDASDFMLKCKVESGKYSRRVKLKNAHLRGLRAGHITREFVRSINNHYKNFTVKDSPINGLRNEFRGECKRHAKKPRGFFSLYGPTGIGKTLSSLDMAVTHAYTNKMDRIYVLSPFGAINEQNAAIARAIFDPDGTSMNVLEMHANFDVAHTHNTDTNRMAYLNYKMLKENHSAPIIYESYVRFFESFLRHKTVPNRYIHQIMNSVIVIDEVQELYVKHIKLFSEILNVLVEQYGCSVFFMSATIPDIFSDLDLGYIRGDVTKIISDPDELDRRLSEIRKVNVYSDLALKKLPLDQFVNCIDDLGAEHGNALVITATRKSARLVYDELIEKFRKRKQATDHIFHLSTSMCVEHRLEILNEIRSRLENKMPVFLVCTRLIEAGVDVDFNCVVKTLSSIPSLEQAKGRCARNGRTDGTVGHFWIIGLCDDVEMIKSMRDVAIGRDITAVLLMTHKTWNLSLVNAYATKYKEYIRQELRGGIDQMDIPIQYKPEDKDHVNELYRTHGVFRLLSGVSTNDSAGLVGISGYSYPNQTISENVTLIPHNQINIIVPFNDAGIDIIDRIQTQRMEAIHFRKIHRYVVPVFRDAFATLVRRGVIDNVIYSSADAEMFGDGNQYFILNDRSFYGDFGLDLSSEHDFSLFFM